MKKKLFFLAAATIALASCSNEEVIETSRHNAGIDFRASIAQGATTRGVETTAENLKHFYVTAMNGNKEWFSNVLFSRVSDNTNIYESVAEYLWPGHGSLDFFAWGYNAGVNSADNTYNTPDRDKCGTVVVNNNGEGQLVFTPAKNIPDQIDLIAATLKAAKGDSKENGVGLDFSHALCEIQINAQSNNSDYWFDVCGFAVCKIKKPVL